jgi:uncharacterized peroxidase-related enzyme
MDRITPLDPRTTTGAAKQLFDGVQAKLGVVPNLFRVLGNAPAALAGYLDFGAALGNGEFDAKLREQIALTVAESNQCGYCLSAHTFVGRKVGLTEQQIADARHANADGERADAILKLARSIVVRRGEIPSEELEQARVAGMSEADIVETVANVALNIFSNYVNHIAETVVDFPEVKPGNGYVTPSCACA